jgi:hypothetical protein
MDKERGFTLPTMDEIEKVWDIPNNPDDDGDEENDEEESETEEEKAALKDAASKKYHRSAKVLTWWMDSFIPMAVGLEFWGPNIRPFKYMTDKTVVEGDPAGEEKVLVTITSEAFAYVLYKNGRDKWMADYAYLKNNPRAKMTPKYKKDDSSTFKHANKWSNSNTGSMVGAGWHTDAL